MSHNNQKKIAVINDFSGFGRCSLTVSLPIISAMKIQCCPIPTAIFSNHTGFDSFYYNDYTNYIEKYIDEWKKLDLKFNGIYTGFLGSADQIGIVENFLKYFKETNTIVVIDPVMGDYGKLYPTYTQELSQKMSTLVKYADILTPNLTEACILTNTPYKEDYSEDILLKMCKILSKQGPKKIVISGIHLGEDIGNYVFEYGKEPLLLKVHKIGESRAGTGDVFASIISADAVNCNDFYSSVKKASSFISKCIDYTTKQNIPITDGVCFEEFLTQL